MSRALLALLALTLAPMVARAQQPFADPTVWVSSSGGLILWSPAPEGTQNRSEVLTSALGVSIASPRWMAQAGLQVSHKVGIHLDFSRGFNFEGLARPSGRLTDGLAFVAADDEARPFEPVTFRTVYAMGGPWVGSRWFMAGAAVGPAVTWGTRERYAPPVPAEEGGWVSYGAYEDDGYLNPGLAGSLQGFVRLDGRVWVGGETMAVVNAASTHLATRLALRVDLRRPDR